MASKNMNENSEFTNVTGWLYLRFKKVYSREWNYFDNLEGIETKKRQN